MSKIDREIKKANILSLIINLLSSKNRSIAELQKITEIPRSTLVYYLGLLEIKGQVEKERIEKFVTGRPTIYKIKKGMVTKIKKQKSKQTQYFIHLLEELKKNSGLMSEKDFRKMSPYRSKTPSLILCPINLIYHHDNLVEKCIRIRSNGLKFLREYKNEISN